MSRSAHPSRTDSSASSGASARPVALRETRAVIGAPFASTLCLACLLLACGGGVNGGSGGATASVGSTVTGATDDSSSASSVSSATSASGGGGAGPTSSSASTGTAGPCACLDTSVCDCDADGHERYDPAHGCVAADPASGDCDDCNAEVFPGQTKYFSLPKPPGFDYDCNGASEPKYVEGSCGDHTGLGVGGCSLGFAETTVSCGQPVAVDLCGLGLLPLSPCIVASTSMLSLPCH